MRRTLCVGWLVSFLLVSPVPGIGAGDWSRFRGPAGQGKSEETGLPVRWSAGESIFWKAELPGPGGSSPIVVGDRVFVTSYTGYGVKQGEGDQKELKRHLLCFDRRSGELRWRKEWPAALPEHAYQGEGAYHGYSSSTPVSDRESLYVFLGKSGLHCLDLEGNPKWEASVGTNVHGAWGSGSSPILYENLVIVNASAESGSLVALDRATGKEAWRAGGLNSSWATPIVVQPAGGEPELVVSVEARLLAFQPATGQPLWNADGIHRYICPSVVSHAGVVYAIGGGHTSLAVRAGGRGDVTQSHVAWRVNKGSNVSSPVYHDGHLYWAHEGNGIVYCQNAATGEFVYEQRLDPRPGNIWASALLADGKLYYVSQHAGTYVVAAKPQFELLAHNVIEGDDHRSNASPAASQGQLFLRTDQSLYCIGNSK